MEGSTDDYGAPDSWEVADLDAAMTKLILSCKKDSSERVDAGFAEASPSSASSSAAASSSSSSLPSSAGVERDGGASEDVINQVDQFLREALQNPRERLSSKLSSRICLFFSIFVLFHELLAKILFGLDG